jgi:metallophosphoesterase (TIGR00282 family)
LRALILGDVFGQPGLRAIFFGLRGLIKEYKADLVVVNGENAADGLGITPEQAASLFSAGVDVLTSGNHIWQKRDILPILDSNPNILRPSNYPAGVPGKGVCVIERCGVRVTVMNLQGRESLAQIDCPFKVAKELVKKAKRDGNCIIADFHAESAQEKEALAYYLDGQISLLYGTHTHVQTMDERILPRGTGFISDVGMTGPDKGVIGGDVGISIERSLTQMPLRIEVADIAASMQGILATIDCETGKCLGIERIRRIE